MADYLGGVLARATGAAETVRPRVPALFAPAGFGAADVTAVAPPARSAGVDRPEEPAEPELPSERSSEQDGAEPAAARKQTEIAEDRRAEPPTERAAPAELPVQAPVSRVESAEADAPPTTARPGRGPALDAPLALARNERRARHPAQDIGRAYQPIPPKPPDVQERLRTIVEEVLVQDGAPLGSRLSSPPSMLGVHDVPSRRPGDRPALEAALARTSSRSSEGAGETLVHVSIGRVEVSAPAALPQPASARRSRKPPTSLDEYLGRRNGTRR